MTPDPRRGPAPLGDLDPEEFRRHAHRLADWIADYLDGLEDLPVLPDVEPGEIRALLPASPPAEPEPLEAILADVDRVVLPGMTHWPHPRFFAWFNSSGSAPGILAETLSAAFNVNGMTWLASPAATELEQVTLDWLRSMLGLPDGLWGIVNEGASLNGLLALAAARESLGREIRERGLAGRDDLPRLRVYASEHAHSSIDKAALTLGFGVEGIRKVAVDDEFRMRPEGLEDAIAEDRADGWLPTCVVATVGTTSSTSIDPVPEIAEICDREAVWLHVDAAHGGAAALVPEWRDVLAGCDRADSLVVNPHKWMFVPIDFSVLYTRRPEVLRAAFSLVPEYLRNFPEDAAENRMDYGVTLGRRFRALKLWFVIRAFGADGLAARIRDHLRLGALFAEWVDADPRFERLAPVPLSTVCFRARPAGISDEDEALNAYNERLLGAVNRGGEVFLTHTKLDGRTALRMVVSGIRTEERHVRQAWERIRAVERELAGQGAGSR